MSPADKVRQQLKPANMQISRGAGGCWAHGLVSALMSLLPWSQPIATVMRVNKRAGLRFRYIQHLSLHVAMLWSSKNKWKNVGLCSGPDIFVGSCTHCLTFARSLCGLQVSSRGMRPLQSHTCCAWFHARLSSSWNPYYFFNKEPHPHRHLVEAGLWQDVWNPLSGCGMRMLRRFLLKLCQRLLRALMEKKTHHHVKKEFSRRPLCIASANESIQRVLQRADLEVHRSLGERGGSEC